MSHEDLEGIPLDSAPLGVKVLICFLLADGVRRGVELAQGQVETPGGPAVMIFILWILIDLLLAVLLALKTRAGRWWTQAILAIHVFYLGHELALKTPHLWLTLSVAARTRIVATVFLDGFFVAYLNSQQAKSYLQDGP